MCVGVCFGYTPPILLGCGLGMFVWACYPNPARPGWGFWCTFRGAGFGFTPPRLAGVCAVRVEVWV